MKKGKIKIDKKGKAKWCKNEAGKQVSISNIFDFSNFKPETGTRDFDCEFELDEKNRVSQLKISGKIVPFLQEKLKEKENKENKAKEREKQKQKEDQERKENEKLIEDMKSDFARAEFAKLPSDTKNLLNGNEWKITNFSLQLNKLARFDEDERDFSKSKFQFFKTNRGKIIYEPKHKFSKKLILEICNKTLKSAKSVFRKEENLFTKNLKPDWRMVVGLGGESVYETSITLHHIYGIPFIPASSIKGVVRSWIITEVFGEKSVPENEKDFPLINAEFRALTMNNKESESFCEFFGCPKDMSKIVFKDGKPVYKRDKNGKLTTKYEKEKATGVSLKNKEGKSTEHIGLITFFDAFPTKEPNIEPDIMNSHYGDYYGKDINAPTDFLKTNPIPFLTVKDTPFQFVIGSKNEKLEGFKIGKKDDGSDKTISDWLKDALENHGIGAKTAVGYGRMK